MLAQTLVAEVLDIGLSGGADFAEIFLEDMTVNKAEFTDGRPRTISGRDYGLGLRLVKGLNTVYAYTNDVSRKSLVELARSAAVAFNAEQEFKVLDFSVAPERGITPIKIYPDQIELKEKIDLLRQGYHAAMAYDTEISQAQISYHDWDQKVLIANSEGTWVEDRRTRSRYMINAVASFGSDYQSGMEGYGASKGFELFDCINIPEMAAKAAEVAKTMVHAAYAPSGKMAVVMENGFGGVLFHEACGHGLEAAFVSKDSSVYAGKLGQQVASPLVTAIDDGTIENSWGSSNYDDEGTPTQRNLLIENGILKGYLVDRISGKRMGCVSTGSSRRESYKFAPTSRMNNTYIQAGSSTREEIISDTEYGLYAKSLGGGSVDVVTGEFNFAVREAYLIENGKLSQPVRGASLIGTGLEVLQKIDMVGQDLLLSEGMCGAGSGMIPASLGQAPLRISSLTVGGRE